MEKADLNVLIGGEAGQGLVTIGDLLAKSLVRAGKEVSNRHQSLSSLTTNEHIQVRFLHVLVLSTGPLTPRSDFSVQKANMPHLLLNNRIDFISARLFRDDLSEPQVEDDRVLFLPDGQPQNVF